MSLSTIIESYDVNVCLVTQAIVHYIIHSLFLFLNMLPKCFIQKCTLIYRTKKPLPMQIDGEPWMQPPCTVSVHHFQNTNFLHKSHSNDSIFWICSLKRFIQIHRLILFSYRFCRSHCKWWKVSVFLCFMSESFDSFTHLVHDQNEFY